MYVLGVDAGNTKTIALVARLDGVIVGMGRGGCGDIYDTTKVYGHISAEAAANAALTSVEDAVGAALSMAGASPRQLKAGGFNMAGADWPEDFAFLQAAIERRGFGRTILIMHDSIGALHAGSPDGTGVSVVCGTGTAIGARSPDGRVWHTSHWQEAHGGQELGKKGLRAVYRAELGIEPPTSLTLRALDAYGQRTVEDVLHLFTAREGTPPRDIDRLAPAVLEEAHRGDGAARRIVQELGAILGDYALVAARRVGIADTPFTLVLAGGVLRADAPLLAESIVERVRLASPEVHPVRSRFEPAVGALLVALEAAGASADAPLLEHLVASLPPQAFFAT